MARKFKIQLRRDTAANWTSADPTLAAGECGFETDTGSLKIGDGTTAWNSLGYATGGSGAPTGADYLVGTANGGLSAEIVVGTSPGGELGGTWASPTVDATHSGSAHHDAVTVGTGLDVTGQLVELDLSEVAAGGELGGFMDAPTVDATHSGSAHADFIAKAFLDAKGDLISASADNTPAIVTAGANDTILMADSGAAAGLKWVASATPSDQAFGDTAAVGTGDTFTRGDHKHGMPADPTTGIRAVDVLVGTATGEFSSEIVVGTTPGGQLGGTWASPTIDSNHAGEIVAKGSDVPINDTNYVTVATATYDIASGDSFRFRVAVLILNNSGSARTYTVGVDINGLVVDIPDANTQGASATNHAVWIIEGDAWVAASNLAYVSGEFRRSDPVAANTANSQTAGDFRKAWNSTTSDLTGASKVVRVRIKSSNATATQTAHVLVSEIEKI